MTSIDNGSPLDLTDLFWATWRQKWLAFAVFILLATLCIGLLFLLPDQYTSRAQLLVRLGPNSGAADPTVNPDQSISLQESRLHQVNSVLELLTSHEMLERVAKRVGPEEIVAPIGTVDEFMSYLATLAPEEIPDSEPGYTGEQVQELILLGEACEQLEDGLEAYAGKNAYTINLAYNCGSPYLSNRVMKAVLEEYPDYHTRAHESTGSVQYFESEVESALQTAQDNENKVRDTKIKHGILDLAASQLALREKLSELESSVNLVEGDLAEVIASITQMQTELKSMPEQIQSEELTGIFKQSGDLVRQQLYALELREKELSTKVNSDHPKMQAIRLQLDEGRRIANSEIGTEPQILNVVNPNRQAMDLALRNAMARRAGLLARKATLDKQHEAARMEMKQLATVGSELNELKWDSEVAQAMYKETAKRLANARQVSGLESLRLSDVSIAQPATLQLTRVGPLRLLIGSISLAIIAFISMIIAASRDFRKARVEARKRRSLGIPTGPEPVFSPNVEPDAIGEDDLVTPGLPR